MYYCSSTAPLLEGFSSTCFARWVLPALARYRSMYRLASHVLARLSCVAVSERCSSLKTGIVTELGSFCNTYQTVDICGKPSLPALAVTSVMLCLSQRIPWHLRVRVAASAILVLVLQVPSTFHSQ